MKKSLLILLAICATFCACQQNDPEQRKAYCDFSYKADGLTVKFTNKSVGIRSYRWDFGDRSYSYEENPTCKYDRTGDYKVTLTGTTYDGAECSHSVTIHVESGVEEYIISGYKLYSIPYANKYYLWYCEGMTLSGGEDFLFNTVYTPKLSSSNMPYTYTFVNKPLLADIDDYQYFTITVGYCSTQEYGEQTQCLKQKLLVSELKNKKGEYILTSDNGKTKIGILMEYK